MKNMNDIREILSEEIDALRADKISVERAQAGTNQIGKYLHNLRLELERVRLSGSWTPRIEETFRQKQDKGQGRSSVVRRLKETPAPPGGSAG